MADECEPRSANENIVFCPDFVSVAWFTHIIQGVPHTKVLGPHNHRDAPRLGEMRVREMQQDTLDA